MRLLAAIATAAILGSVLLAGPGATAQAGSGASEPSLASASIAIPSQDTILDGLAGGHPRIILTPAAVADLQARIAADPTLAATYATVKARATTLLAEPPVTYDKPDGFRLLPTSRTALHRLYDLGLVWQVEGDPAMAARAWQELAAVIAFPDWNPIHFLDTAEMSHAVAIGYDWFYDALTPQQRAQVEQALIIKGLTPARDAYAGDAILAVAYWTVVNHNWNNVVNGGMTVGALAIADIDPALASYVLHEALTRLPQALAHYAPDGGWPEGVGYWQYATDYTIYAIGALESALGTDFGISDVEGFAQTGDVPIHMTGPTGQRFNWADDGEPRHSPATPSEMWLATRFADRTYYDQAMAHAQPHALDVVWYRAFSGPPEALDRDHLFKGIDVASTRSGWTDVDAMWVASKGGDNAMNHNQLDLGSFVLESQGERFAIDLGKEGYNVAGYWEHWPGGTRWTYYRSRAEGHNTLVIDPDSCEDQDPRAKATITRFAASDDGSFSIIDLSNAYRLPARRGIGLFGRDTVVIQDELDAGAGADVWWFTHTRADIDISPDGRSATLTQNDQVMEATLLAPAAATFEIMDATPLPSSPSPDSQSPNDGIRKLSIHLGASGMTTLAVAFTEPGTDPPTGVLELDDWSVPGPLTQDVTRQPEVTEPSANACDPIVPPSPTEPLDPPPTAEVTPVNATPVFTG